MWETLWREIEFSALNRVGSFCLDERWLTFFKSFVHLHKDYLEVMQPFYLIVTLHLRYVFGILDDLITNLCACKKSSEEETATIFVPCDKFCLDTEISLGEVVLTPECFR